VDDKRFSSRVPVFAVMEYGHVLVWVAVYAALGTAALPAAAALFPRFPDRGAALALPVALATLGVVGYLVGHLAFGWPALLAGVAVLGAGSYLLAGRTDASPDLRPAAETGLVFLVAFSLLVAVRAVDPAVRPIGGEKFLDFGLLQSLLRAPRLPPEDMWFAGEPVQYYYGGHLISALLARLTFTPPRFAYNLALAGFYATLVTAAYGVAGAVAADHGAPRRLAGGVAAFLVGLAGNLYTFAQVLVWALPDGLARSLAGPFGLGPELLEWTPGRFSYWTASRVMSSEPGNPDAFALITEFPLFAWLNGDLHAHMTSTPFTLLVVALGYAYWRTPSEDRTRRRLLVFGAVPPVVGLLAVVNTWSFPTALGLTWLAVAFAPADPLDLLPPSLARRLPAATRTDGGGREAPDGGRTGTDSGTGPGEFEVGVDLDRWLGLELRRTGGALALAVGLAVLALVWSLPFWLGTASGRSVGLLDGANRSSFRGLLLVHGGFLLAFVPYVARRGLRGLDRPSLAVAALGLLAVFARAWDLAAVALFGPLLLAGWLLVRLRRDAGYETVLMVGGLGIALLVEFLFVVEEAGPGRLNTVFKTYAQVWVLWGVAAGVMLARLPFPGRSSLPSPNPDRWRLAGTLLVASLVLTSGLYAALALPAQFERGSATANADGPTLDATRFVELTHPREADAIAWVDSLPGTPNIVTAAPAGYRWRPDEGRGAAAPSSLTGVPTVAGWYHERGYRGGEAYTERVADVETIYTGSPDAKARLLAAYDVEYVYVGPAERAKYGDVSFEGVPGVSVARTFSHGGERTVTIYRVDRSAVSDP
jgi:YYY domain-containing protein